MSRSLPCRSLRPTRSAWVSLQHTDFTCTARIPAHPQELCDPACILPVGLHRHRRQRRLHVAGLQQNDLMPTRHKGSLQPLRQRPCLQTNALHPHVQSVEIADKRLRRSSKVLRTMIRISASSTWTWSMTDRRWARQNPPPTPKRRAVCLERQTSIAQTADPRGPKPANQGILEAHTIAETSVLRSHELPYVDGAKCQLLPHQTVDSMEGSCTIEMARTVICWVPLIVSTIEEFQRRLNG